MRYSNRRNEKSEAQHNEGASLKAGHKTFFSFFVFRFSFSRGRGISLVETIVYVGLLGIISVFVANSLIRIVSTYEHTRAERDVLSNARLIMETLTKKIAYSREVYAPTSRFNNDTGQVSLITPFDTLPGHATAYLDIWTDGTRLLMRQEGQATTTLSSPSVRITQFRVGRIFQRLGREAVQITLSISSNALPSVASTTLHSTTALRGNY